MIEKKSKDGVAYYAWTIQDEAIHRGYNYADANQKPMDELMREGASLFSILKNAYQEGFLHGFAHKFDNTNYEEKTDADN